MLFEDSYLTISAQSEGAFSNRGSKFRAFAYPISSELEIKALVTHLKSEHPKANHHCWAIRISTDRSIFRVNDDGEPSGTAGRPILNVLLSHNLTNILVIVVRYFGGTLLGVPGLINAYKLATEDALNKAKIIEKTVNDIYKISFNCLLMNEVMKVVKSENLIVTDQKVDTYCDFQLQVRKSQVENVLGTLQGINGVKIKWMFTL